MKHFEELWEKCEILHKENGGPDPVPAIMDELSMKVNLYKLLDGKEDLPQEEREKVKSRTLGEILLTLTNLSLKDNINVFEALNIARQYREAELSVKIPSELKLPKKL